MSFRIQDSLAWISKALGIDRASSEGMDLQSPGTVLDTIQAVVPAKGWQACARTGFFSVTSAGPTQTVSGPFPPIGENWYLIGASLRHNQATTHTLRIDFFDSVAGTSIVVRDAVPLGNLVFIGIARPLLLRPGQRISGESNTSVAAGSNLILRGIYVILRDGESLPGAGPYG